MASVKDSPVTTHIPYQDLPAELKLNVWEELSMPRGVHHFHIDAGVYRFNNELTQDIIVKPIDKAKDTSVWRVRNRAKWVDACSWHALSKKLEAKPKTRQFWPRTKEIVAAGTQKIEEGTDVAIVDLENDLVCFTHKGMLLQTFFIKMFPWQEFHGVTRVALEFRTVLFNQKPYFCPCPEKPHKVLATCPDMLNCFFSYFEDLEVFYFVLKLTCATIMAPKPDVDRTGTRSAKKVLKSKAPRVSKKEYIPTYLARFRGT